MGAVKDVPQQPYACIVTQYGVDPDWAYQHLKCVELKEKKLKKYRIFDADLIPAGAKVKDYAWFDAHPELIMFEGWIGDDGRMDIQKKAGK